MSQNRVYQSYYPYFVTTNAYENEPLFKENLFAEILMQNIFLFCAKYKFTLYGYSLMPNHLHIFLKTTSCANISRVIGAIKSKTFVDLKRKGIAYPLWQARFYHKIKYKEKSFKETLKYIKNNPVKAGLEEKYHKLPYLYICETGLKLQ